MLDNEKERFYSILVGSAEVAGKSLSKHGMILYWNTLRKFDISDVEKAFEKHALNPDGGQFMAKPADIVKYIEGSGDDASMKAWSKVEQTVRRVGAYVQDLIFDDPIIHAVLRDMGGWTQLCQTPTEQDMHFQSIEFCKRYRGYLNNNRLDYPSRLTGLVADGEKPLLIGDVAKAEKVALEGNDEPLKMTHIDEITKKLTNGEDK